jgi:hypothetical protein
MMFIFLIDLTIICMQYQPLFELILLLLRYDHQSPILLLPDQYNITLSGIMLILPSLTVHGPGYVQDVSEGKRYHQFCCVKRNHGVDGHRLEVGTNEFQVCVEVQSEGQKYYKDREDADELDFNSLVDLWKGDLQQSHDGHKKRQEGEGHNCVDHKDKPVDNLS